MHKPREREPRRQKNPVFEAGSNDDEPIRKKAKITEKVIITEKEMEVMTEKQTEKEIVEANVDRPSGKIYGHPSHIYCRSNL